MCLTAHFFPDICFGTLLEVVTGSLGMTKGEGKWQFSLEGSSVQGTGDGQEAGFYGQVLAYKKEWSQLLQGSSAFSDAERLEVLNH